MRTDALPSLGTDSKNRWAALVLGAFLAVPAAAAPQAQSSSTKVALDFEALGRGWLAAHGFEGDALKTLKTERVVEESFVHFQLGILDLRLPDGAFTDDSWTAELGDVFQALLSEQERWMAWLEGSEDESGLPKEMKAHAKTVRSWIKSWKGRELESLAGQHGVDLLEALAPKDKVRESIDALNAYLVENGVRKTSRRQSAAPKVILIPHRKEFVEFACAVGLLESRLRSIYWADDLITWTYFDVDGTRALALEYWDNGSGDDYTQGIRMTSRNPHALEEHLTQLTSRSLFEGAFGERLDPILAAGLANVLVIDIFGEVDTRTDGDLRARVTQGRSVFVPGGNSSGGVLPPVSADNRWRANKGAGYFVKELKNAQKQGAKGGDKLRGFKIEGESSASVTIQAPILGPDAFPDDQVPAGCRADYVEFLRAYRCAFLYWLRSHAAGRESPQRFGETLARLNSPEGPRDFPSVLQEMYGAPMTSPEPGTDDLEGQFLAWLAKQ